MVRRGRTSTRAKTQQEVKAEPAEQEAGWSAWPDVAPSWGDGDGGWPPVTDDHQWEWEAAGDESIKTDDPHREKKINWRIEHEHVQSCQYRVERWIRNLPANRYATREEVLDRFDTPAEEEVDYLQGCRLKSRSRSRSKGRQGRQHRHQKIVDWNNRDKGPVVRPPNDDSDDNSTVNEEMDPDSSRTRAPSDQLRGWIDSLTKKGNYRYYQHVEKAKALEFFERPLQERVRMIESISRELNTTVPACA